MNEKALEAHLVNHLAAAAAAVDLFHRVAKTYRDAPEGVALAALEAEAVADHDALVALMTRRGFATRRPLAFAARVGERLGRLKPNGGLVRRSPASDLLELEGLRTSVALKLAGWEGLRVLAQHDQELDTARLSGLVGRAEDQAERLRGIHLDVVARLA